MTLNATGPMTTSSTQEPFDVYPDIGIGNLISIAFDQNANNLYIGTGVFSCLCIR
jgi:hypothetical protein